MTDVYSLARVSVINLWLMFYETCWSVVTGTKPFSLFLISIQSLCKLNLDIEQIMREISKYCFG